jgi:hypothetical protein
MSSNIFSGGLWSVEELKDLLKKLEGMYAQGVRQSTFGSQTLIFNSTEDIKDRITALRLAITEKEEDLGLPSSVGKTNSAANKKQVRIQTKSRGFGTNKGRFT